MPSLTPWNSPGEAEGGDFFPPGTAKKGQDWVILPRFSYNVAKKWLKKPKRALFSVTPIPNGSVLHFCHPQEGGEGMSGKI